MQNAPLHNLLALSDLDLGCDLKSGAPYGRDARRAQLDRLLVRFLDHHALHREGGKPRASFPHRLATGGYQRPLV